MSDANSPLDDETFQSFVAECREMLEEVEPRLIELEQYVNEEGSVDSDTINFVFRMFHSIKGGAGFFNLDDMVKLTHEAETLLDLFRNSRLEMTSLDTDILCRACDIVNLMVDQLESSGQDKGFESEVEGILKELNKRILRETEEIKEIPQDKEPQTDKISEKAPQEVRPVEIDLSLDMNGSQFINDSYEQLARAEKFLSELEKNLENRSLFDKAAIAFKEFQETCKSTGYDNLVGLSVNVLEILTALNQGTIEKNASQIPFLKHIVEIFRTTVKNISEQGKKEISNIDQLTAVLGDMAKGKMAPNPEDLLPSNADASEGDITPEMILKFVQECAELIDEVETSLLNLEKTPESTQDREQAFRSIHSFKGNCGLYGFAHLEQLSHLIENVLEEINNDRLDPDDMIVPVMLTAVDSLRKAVEDISEGGPGEIGSLAVLSDLMDDIIPSLSTEKKDISARPEIEQPEALSLLRKDMPVPKQAEAVSTPTEKSKKPEIRAKSRSTARQDIRVNLGKLDNLVNLVGELVIAESMITKSPDLKGLELEMFERSCSHLSKIVQDLQDIALSLRMIPISGIFRKMVRLVHDLAIKCNKKINLKMTGEDTEIDKTVSELLADPLVHIIRNCIDHGIESPDERNAKGKDPVGEIFLEAKYEGNEIWLVIRDDGKGLDREKILAKGIERGLVREDEEKMNDQDVYNLIFQPGFSTAENVTDLSGRGVGMDVVRKNMEKINGEVEIESKPGVGSKITIRIPLTLAIIDGMLVRVGCALYTIPLLGITESIQVEPNIVTVTMSGDELIRFRGKLVPVVRLHKLHHIMSENTDLDKALIVIVEHQGEMIGIMIDEIVSDHQAVIKSLSNYIGNIKGVSGCTILGDGEISLIVDVGGIIKRARTLDDSMAEQPVAVAG